MKEKAVFFATKGMVGSDELYADLSSAMLSSEEWKSLRLLTRAGYTIVLFTPDRAAVRAGFRNGQPGGSAGNPEGESITRQPSVLNRKVTPLLQATEKLQINLANSWMVGDKLDSIEVGRMVGCKTILLTDGSERTWDMTPMRWPDLIAGDLWETACLIVMSDGSSVEDLSSVMDDDDE